MLSRPRHLVSVERKGPSYLLCSALSDRRLERALSDAYDQLTAWRWVAERLAAKLLLPQERLDHAVLEVSNCRSCRSLSTSAAISGTASSRGSSVTGR